MSPAGYTFAPVRFVSPGIPSTRPSKMSRPTFDSFVSVGPPIQLPGTIGQNAPNGFAAHALTGPFTVGNASAPLGSSCVSGSIVSMPAELPRI